MTITAAHINDSEILTEITKKSKAYWGYPDEQIIMWSGLLTITKTYIEAARVYKLLSDNKIIAYYSYVTEDENSVRLDNLFVLPDFIGQGFGRLLMNDFLYRLTLTGIKKVITESDPNAEKFYSKFGFIKAGQVKTVTKGRYLPLMELHINNTA